MTSVFDPQDTPLPLDYFQRKYQISRTTMWRYRRAGLPAITVGNKCFLRESDFVSFLLGMNGRTVGSLPREEAEPR